MMKLVLVTILLVLISASKDCDIIQESFNGLFEENKLPKPQQSVKCFSDSTCTKLVKFAG